MMRSNQFKKLKGQAMILAVLAIGGSILGATTIAGLLTLFQIRESTDAINSARAIFAADSGIECGLYSLFKNGSCPLSFDLSNGSSYQATVDPGTFTVISRGFAANARRAFSFQAPPN